MTLYPSYRSRYVNRFILRLALLCLIMATILPLNQGVRVMAQSPDRPAVGYDATTNTISIGDDYTNATYAGHPSHPDAPKSAITIPELKIALGGLVSDSADLLEDQGSGTWLLKANVMLHQTARLAATDATIAWLRLDSTTASIHIVADGGHLLIQGIKVTSWDTNTQEVDTNHSDGRSYLLADRGGRMDIIDAEAAYLGWAPGKPSGLSWHQRATADRPETGATGNILRSDIHHNYFGQYAYEAYGMQILDSDVHHNLYYGIAPHDYSMEFEVARNRVYNNGKHGIIFSRHCTNNRVYDNEVFDNAGHGIMFDRDSSGVISNNEVYGNSDGIAIFQSSGVTIQNNTLRNNKRGIRVNAPFDNDDSYDGISIDNVMTGNTIQDNTEYGIYLYERADNNIIVANTIAGNSRSGIYIKTGGNEIADNEIRANGHGILVWGNQSYTIPDPLPAGAPTPVDPVGESGVANRIYRNTIEDNDHIGVYIRNSRDSVLGASQIDQLSDKGNIIRTNGTHGVSIVDSSSNNRIIGNVIHGNGADGILVKGEDARENMLRRNSITANVDQGITIGDDANSAIAMPQITSVPDAEMISGTALPDATVEVYYDPDAQGQIYVGSAQADDQGIWNLIPTRTHNPETETITAIAIDARGNTSAFATLASTGLTRDTQDNVLYKVAVDTRNDQEFPTIYVANRSNELTSVTLSDIQSGIQALTDTLLLENQGNGVWQLNASVMIRRNIKLELTSAELTWLKLRSQANDITLAADQANYNYKSFVTLRTHDGQILIDGITITSWNPEQNTYDMDIANGRSYLLAKYDARMDIYNATLSYLGSADGESYGLSWRDINDDEAPDELRARVTGEVIDSEISYNYYGIYTYQASNMIFRGNKFHNNISYGFDPHDFSNNFLVENNEAFENGNHGFIISRGCNNFVFRNNKSYNNRYTIDDKDRAAHGFMLDPGSPNSRYVQVPSFDNLLENNETWGNDGYGLRILGSNNNTVRNNIFRDNLQGITVERGSTGNLIENNTMSGNGLYGIFVFSGADTNTLTGNRVSQNGVHGIYVKTGGITITNNTVTENGTIVDGEPSGSGIAFLSESTAAAAVADWRLPRTATSLAEDNPELQVDLSLASSVQENIITGNTVVGNAEDGIEMKSVIDSIVEANLVEKSGSYGIYLSVGAQRNRITQNTIRNNQDYGIKANGEDTFENIWTENLVYDNSNGGIVTTSKANNNIKPPVLIRQQNVVTGTTTPGTVVEIFSDTGGQGRFFEGRTTANADGEFTFTATQGWQASRINATATDAQGNSSAFTYNLGASADNQLYLPLVVR